MSSNYHSSHRVTYLIDDENIPIRPNRRSISKSLTLKKRKQFSNIATNADQISSGTSNTQTASASLTDLKAQLFKFVVIGESGAGKSNLISRFTRDQFDARSKSTIGIDFALHTFHVKSKKRKGLEQDDEFRAQIWDTAGQERYRSMTRLFYRDVCGALLVFDLTNRAHLSALPRWLTEINANQHWSGNEIMDIAHSSTTSSSYSHNYKPVGSVPIILIGNKVDRRDREITPEEGTEFVRQNSLSGYFETSAKTGQHVDEAFQALFEASIEYFASKKPNIHRANSFKLGPNRVHKDNNSNHFQQSQTIKYSNNYGYSANQSKQEKIHSKSKCSC